MSGRSRLVSELAEAQFGVVTWGQLRALGVPPATISDWASAGWLHRVFPRVYAVGHTALRWEARLMAAVLCGGDGAVVSHASAAAWLALRESHSRIVDVSLASGRRRRPGIRWRRAALAAEDVTVHERIPVTTPARTALDMAGGLDDAGTRRLLVRADRQRLLDPAAVRAAFRRCPGNPGGARLIRVLDAYVPQLVHARSGKEVDAAAILIAAGLPEPVLNGRIETDIGWLEVDLVWRDQRVAIEVDTFFTHGDARAFEEDRRRDAALARAGWSTGRVTDVTIAERPAEFVATVARLLSLSP